MLSCGAAIRGGEAQRRALTPVLWTAGAAFSAFLVAKGIDAATASRRTR